LRLSERDAIEIGLLSDGRLISNESDEYWNKSRMTGGIRVDTSLEN
jgi:hypothetical protein